MRRAELLACALVCVLATASVGRAQEILGYDDGVADGKRSLGGSGEMVAFVLPTDKERIAGIRIHGSRYGQKQAPDEKFLIFFVSKDLSRIIHTEMAPYELFAGGKEKWVEVLFKEPVAVPAEVWIALDFRAHRTKGVYVSYDTSTAGEHSRSGLPGTRPRPNGFDGDWMVQIILAEP